MYPQWQVYPRHCHISPEVITTEQFKDYIAFRVQQQNVSVSIVNQLIGAWRIFQVDILGRKWEDFKVKRPRKEKKYLLYYHVLKL